MKVKTGKVLAGAVAVSLLILLLILWLCFGFTKAFFIFAGIDSVAILAIFIWAMFKYSSLDRRLSMARRTALDGEELRLQYSILRKVAGLPTLFRYEQLEAATDGFRAVLGKGSSASVFKGILDDGTAVAVKRIDGQEHGEEEFRAEVTALASVQHLNLVRLLGYCLVPRGPRFLVYEFIENGSLDSWIFSGDSGRSTSAAQRLLPWEQRCAVALDVARALAYLHHDCRSRVLHLDVKPENILLDEVFRACVADFGLSKLMSRDESRVVTTVRGTRGGVSEKSDVYSYGMVLLEIVGGRRNVRLVGDGPASQRKWSYFPRIVAEKVRQGREMEVEENQVKAMLYVALWCIQEKPTLRPTMARVVDMLSGRAPVEVPPETEMVVVDLLAIDHDDAGDSAAAPPHAGQNRPMSAYFASLSTLSPGR
ncbi:unnamed protein product [Spirodela intermedia]|uniref:Protein kinase domain-containing protein n=1 Tax=Spirodela intermedia TaxID=51605 RepID=A0A7I8JNL5_SPIIN|nr:unnamed protein product [Spirodela intermedia]CAA6671739.1 unnamed protein product [Spirodela intermedia]